MANNNERKKYLLQDLSYPMQTYLMLSELEVALLKLLVKEGWVTDSADIICLDDQIYHDVDKEDK